LLVALFVVSTFAAGLYAVSLRRDQLDAPMTLYALPPAQGAAAHVSDAWPDLVFIAAIGIDGREGLAGDRADALHVIAWNPGLNAGTIIDIPRDTWVSIPGHGDGRINTAYQLGGVGLQVDVLRNLTGAPISYALVTTFPGLVEMVDRLGGIDVDVPFPMDDQNSGALFDAGVQHLGGDQALAFSRNRHIPDGDIRRTANQGQLLLHALATMRAKGTSATDTIGYLDILYRNVRLEGLGAGDLYRLARTALRVDPAVVRNYAMPASIGNVGGASVVFARQPAAGSLFGDFADDGVLQGH
jgi:LCP family protein required for cell wall assembly